MATNFEFYKDEILKIVKKRTGFGVVNGEVKSCDEIGCTEQCIFHEGKHFCLLDSRIEWLYAEHIEKPKLTKRERAFCEAVQTGWIARDEGYLYWHIVKPIKDGAAFIFPNSEDSAPMVIKTKGLAFDVIKNKEMMAVADLLEMEVQHETD